MKLREDQRLLAWACVAALALWIVTPLRLLLLPVIYFNTYVHELCHALAALVTGGSVSSILVRADGSGLTTFHGGNDALVTSAGYVGCAIVGGMFVYFSRTDEGAKRMLWVAAAFVGIGLALYVRGTLVGVMAGIALSATLVACAIILEDETAVFVAQFLGVQQCLASLYAFISLLTITAKDLGETDAAIMERATHVPAMVWSLLWLGFGLFAIGIGIKASWANRPPPGSV